MFHSSKLFCSLSHTPTRYLETCTSVASLVAIANYMHTNTLKVRDSTIPVAGVCHAHIHENVLYATAIPKCQKLCWHNQHRPNLYTCKPLYMSQFLSLLQNSLSQYKHLLDDGREGLSDENSKRLFMFYHPTYRYSIHFGFLYNHNHC